MKSKYPTRDGGDVLLEQDIPYDVLVQTMDNVRVFAEGRRATVHQGRAVPGYLGG